MNEALIMISILFIISAVVFWITFKQIEVLNKHVVDTNKVLINIINSQQEMTKIIYDIDDRLTRLVKLDQKMAVYFNRQNAYRIKDIQKLYKRSKHEYRSSNIKARKSK